jgi:hypothetical protein
MICNPSQVIVSDETLPRIPIHSPCVHHRDFPEVRAQGTTPHAAALRLVELLSVTLDSAPSGWRRESVENAIEDVLAFVERQSR